MGSQVHSHEDNSARQLQSQTVFNVHVRARLRYTCHGMHSVRHGTSQCDRPSLENPVALKQFQESVVIPEVYYMKSTLLQLQQDMLQPVQVLCAQCVQNQC